MRQILNSPSESSQRSECFRTYPDDSGHPVGDLNLCHWHGVEALTRSHIGIACLGESLCPAETEDREWARGVSAPVPVHDLALEGERAYLRGDPHRARVGLDRGTLHRFEIPAVLLFGDRVRSLAKRIIAQLQRAGVHPRVPLPPRLRRAK